MSLLVKEDEEDTRWEIVHLRAKGTMHLQGSIEQKSPFHENRNGQSAASLDLRFFIRPEGEWEELKTYASCTASGQLYENQDYVFVRPPGLDSSGTETENDTAEATIHDFWVAKILEIKGRDKGDVYARVYWMYWPDDLPMLRDCAVTEPGRRKYHGKYELIASNHMDIINVCTFAGLASVTAWQETDDDEEQTSLYWRQTFDFRTGQLSKLKKHCICEAYYNPDKLIVSCPNPRCRAWLHAECLVDRVLARKCQPLLDTSAAAATAAHKTAAAKTPRPTPRPRPRPRSRKRKTPSRPVRKPYDGLYSAEIVGGGGQGDDGAPRAEITDLRSGGEQQAASKWKEALECPKCATRIE